MKVFVFAKGLDDERTLVGEYDLEQIPHIGEKLLVSHAEGLQALPVVDVRHFVTREGNAQGAFVDVGEGEIAHVLPEVAAIFAG